MVRVGTDDGFTGAKGRKADVNVEEYEGLVDFSDLDLVDYTPMRGMECYVLVDNLPIVGESRAEKLKKVLRLKLGAHGKITDDGIMFPLVAGKNTTMGIAFVEFETHEQALNATVGINGMKLDSKTVLRAIPMMQIDIFLNVPDKYEPPTDNETGEVGHLRSWLGDKKARDQFAILMDDVVYIYWNNRSGPPDLDCSRINWTGYYVKWSPLGTYFTTFHDLGVALWGGPKWEQVCKLEHNGAKLAEYSPNENYVITWSQYPISRSASESHNMILWEISSGKQLRTFQIANSPSPIRSNRRWVGPATDWPRLLWSYDDAFVARLNKDVLHVYTLPSTECVTGKGLKIPRVKHFSWSPGDNIISYWTHEEDNVPARVTLIRIPSMEVVRTKNFFDVNNVHLYWQSSGDYLISVIEGIKSKKQTVTSIEVFRMKERGIPIDRIEIGDNVAVSDVYIEPNGTKFIAIVTDKTSSNCNVYKIISHDDNLAATKKKQNLSTKSKKKKQHVASEAVVSVSNEGIVLLKSIPAREINYVTWAPRGGRCVLAGIKENKLGDIRFWDMNDLILLGAGEHRGCSSVEWDPTGRYFVSFISNWHSASDNGFKIWTFTGKLVASQPFDKFNQFLWRPRPAHLFPDEVGARVRANIKEYSSAFVKEDNDAERAITEKIVNERKALLTAWNAYYAKCVENYDTTAAERNKLWGMNFDSYKTGKGATMRTYYVDVVEEIMPC